MSPRHALHFTPPHFLSLMATVNLGFAERELMFRLLITQLEDYKTQLRPQDPIDLQVLFERTIAGVYEESEFQVSMKAMTLVKRLCFER